MHKAVRVDHVGASVGEGNRMYVQRGCVVSKHLRCRIFGGRVPQRDRGALPARTKCYVSGPCLPTSAQVRSHAHGSMTTYLVYVRTYPSVTGARTRATQKNVLSGENVTGYAPFSPPPTSKESSVYSATVLPGTASRFLISWTPAGSVSALHVLTAGLTPKLRTHLGNTPWEDKAAKACERQ